LSWLLSLLDKLAPDSWLERRFWKAVPNLLLLQSAA